MSEALTAAHTWLPGSNSRSATADGVISARMLDLVSGVGDLHAHAFAVGLEAAMRPAQRLRGIRRDGGRKATQRRGGKRHRHRRKLTQPARPCLQWA